jgi:hypothetical protein
MLNNFEFYDFIALYSIIFAFDLLFTIDFRLIVQRDKIILTYTFIFSK